MVLDDWTEYIKQILNFAGHGYEYYCPVNIPTNKRDKAIQVDNKILEKYPSCKWNKDQRYKAKKANKANYAYIRWDLYGIILHTLGQELECNDPDRFYHLREKPYVIPVGEWLEIKISKARTGKKYTAYMSKASYRNIKALLCEYIEHRQWDAFIKHYYRLENLPAFSGILVQMDELYRFCRAEIKRYKAKVELRKLTLKKVF